MRGVSVLAFLTIICSLASVGVPAWPLYEDGYFLGIPNRTTLTTTPALSTAFPLTTLPFATEDGLTTPNSASNNAEIATGGTDAALTTAIVPTDMPSMTESATMIEDNSTSTPDNTATSMDLDMFSTMIMDNSTMGNTTNTMGPTRAPIPYDTWVVVMAPFAIICLFAFVLVMFSFCVCCITCCCPERSEIVDDQNLYKH